VEGLCGPISKCNRPFSHHVCSPHPFIMPIPFARIDEIMATESALTPHNSPVPLHSLLLELNIHFLIQKFQSKY